MHANACNAQFAVKAVYFYLMLHSQHMYVVLLATQQQRANLRPRRHAYAVQEQCVSAAHFGSG